MKVAFLVLLVVAVAHSYILYDAPFDSLDGARYVVLKRGAQEEPISRSRRSPDEPKVEEPEKPAGDKTEPEPAGDKTEAEKTREGRLVAYLSSGSAPIYDGVVYTYI